MSQFPERRRAAAGPREDDLAALIAELRDTVARQQRQLDAQQAEIEALRKQAGTPPTNPGLGGDTTPSPPGPSSTAPASGGAIATPVLGVDYTIVFDGGAIGNPGRGYGSYQIVGGAGVVAEKRLEFGDKVTNNQAEYRTLIGALEDLRDQVGPAVVGTTVAIRGDSQLVIHQVTGRWKVKHAELRPLHQRAVTLLTGFGRVDVAWHRRDASVRVLGH